MSLLLELVQRIEDAGGVLWLRGDKVIYDLPEEATPWLDQLRANKGALVETLRQREALSAMPSGVRLVAWHLKEPPVGIEYNAVVTDTAKFAKATLEELAERISNPRRKYGWTIPQLVNRLAQVGVQVSVDEEVR